MTDFNLNDAASGDDASQTNSIVSQLHGGSGGQKGPEEFDLTMASSPSRALPLQAMAVGLVLVIAAGSLFLMRRQGTRAGIDFSNTTVISTMDTTIEKVENEDEILAALRTTGPPEQIPSEQVSDSPFKINKLADGGSGPVGMDPGKVAAERRRVQIQEALGKVEVESVMHGRIPIAKISGKVCRVGDSIGGVFVIDRIEGRSVFLTADGNEYEVSMIK